MAPYGFEWKEIPYVVVLDLEGNPVGLDCTYEGIGKARRAKKFLIPQSEKRASNIKANLLWDNPEYVFGIPTKGKPDRVAELHNAFVEKIESLGDTEDKGLIAVRRFLTNENRKKVVQTFETWDRLLDEGANVSFKLAGETSLVCESETVKRCIQNSTATEGAEQGICLVTGKPDVIERLHPPIKGVWGAQSVGANIVSFNLDAFRSFGKDQGANAPVGEEAAFAYTTALNHLLNKDSTQRMQVGDASTVFWSARVSFLEQHFVDFFGEPPKDDPDRNTRAVADLFHAVRNGTLPEPDRETRFYVLGLAPNASRLAIRFWISDTVINMAEKICSHFDDVHIIHGPREQDTLSLFRLLVSTATAGKSENIPPNLAGGTMRAILQGLPYPRTLLQASLRRIRAEHEVTYPRASLIKACINRTVKNSASKKERELTVSLDESNINIGYRLGRLFAALEKVQQEANPGINATIRDKFYGAASGTPVAVFANLMRLKNHHLAKMESTGRRIQFEKLIGAIMESISDFPPHLSLADQGRFAIGYYHQMQNFFTKKDNNNE